MARMAYFFRWTDAALCMNTLTLALLLVFTSSSSLPLQHADPREQSRTVFETVRQGLEKGTIESFANLLAPQVQMNLRGGESGYFSGHQAFYLLESYFRTRRLLNLRFSTVGDSDTSPFATGGAEISIRGSREFVQVYVALSRAGERWVITRLNIY